MSAAPAIRLGSGRDAPLIAAMSRDFIESGLGWSWTPGRVLAAVHDRDTNVAVIDAARGLAAFGIMQYGDETAHLCLLAVHPDRQHQGIGRLLIDWLERPARLAGIERIRLEARADNPSALNFYRQLGYLEAGRVAGYYRGSVDAVRLEKPLRTGLGTLAR